jgi:hypothetical protein
VKPSVARRLRGTAESTSHPISTETVVCSNCGQRFTIRNDSVPQNTELARKQISWVAEQLVWDHIQERKHHGTIELPTF